MRHNRSQHPQLPDLHILAAVLLISFVLNYIWEMAQMPLYTTNNGAPFNLGFWGSMLHCFVPTLGDVAIVGLTFGIGWLVHAHSDWIRRLDWRDLLLMIIPLVLLSITIELVNVYLLKIWKYSDLMPLLPVLKVGVAPIIQLALLTPLTFVLVGGYVAPAGNGCILRGLL